MMKAFESFLTLPEQDDVFEAATDTLPSYVRTATAARRADLFKGGTSLSKAFGLIRRFSEDIDVTTYGHYVLEAKRRRAHLRCTC